MIKLWIKGNLEEAQKAAEKRRIPIRGARQLPVKGPTVLAETEDRNMLSVILWFNEDAGCVEGQGCPPGTLLIHN